MAAPTAEALAIARRVHDFVWDWIPSQLTPSGETARSYRTSVALYVTWLSDFKGVTPSTLSACDLSTERIEGWLSWLAAERGNSPQTCNVRLSALRTFARYVSRHDATFASVEAQVASVPFRRAPKTKIGGMSEAAVAAVLEAPGRSSRTGRRDTALMMTLYSTACRVGEMLHMRKSDVSLDGSHPHAVVRGKGGKARVVYLSEATVRHLRSYIDEFCGFESDGHLFWSRNHTPGERSLGGESQEKRWKSDGGSLLRLCGLEPAGPDE